MKYGIVIYTDLDGSLLDHHSYSHAEADALLAELDARSIPVVPASSKTRAELLHLREELDNGHPFIAENGAAVYIPAGYFADPPAGTVQRDGFLVKEFARPRSHWLDLIAAVAPDFEGAFTGFSAMTTDEIAAITGLQPAAAGRASRREYGEPIHWTGSEPGRWRFIDALRLRGATVLQGGRFMHVSGNCDKGRALLWLNDCYAAVNGGIAPVSIAAGDSQNDTAMLAAADHALVIRSPVNPPPALERMEGVLYSTATGPAGWDEGVRKILATLNTTTDNQDG